MSGRLKLGNISWPRVAVVTVTYNSALVIEDFADSLVHQEGVTARLFAVDNASSDNCVQRLRKYDGKLDMTVIQNAENLGVAEGNNLGIRAARDEDFDWILLVNNDTTFGPTFIIDMLSSAEEGNIKILSPLIMATEPENSVWYATGSLHRNRGFRAGHDGMGRPLAEVARGVSPTEYASTCALLVHTDVFDIAGMMDPQYFVYFDDVDFCIRATAAGFRYWVNSDIVLTHKASSLTGGSLSDFTIFWVSRNWVLICRKHLGLVPRLFAYGYMQLSMLAKLVAGRETLKHYFARQCAFVTGLRLPLAT